MPKQLPPRDTTCDLMHLMLPQAIGTDILIHHLEQQVGNSTRAVVHHVINGVVHQ